ncbi:MAG TPA: hypothetical protein VF120_03495 [Ktedonobacterales bacterium]
MSIQERLGKLWDRPIGRVVLLSVLAAVVLATLAIGVVRPMLSSASSCQLAPASGTIHHVIYLQFDNVHFTRDNPNVPSDLEQMPHLLRFLEDNGALLTNHHTPLIAHTADDILTSLTGVYGDQHGVPVANSYGYFTPSGASSASSFGYWTAPLYDSHASPPTDTRYNMLDAAGKNAPAPWVPFTRAGCNVGAVGMANMVLENATGDVRAVFGAGSPEASEAAKNASLAQTEFVGLAVHCANGVNPCASANGARPDALPDEPGGYNGYQALFGAKYVDPAISSGGQLDALDGKLIADAKGSAGFPGFDGMSADVSLAYVAAMQEHGIPITYAYLSDLHDNHMTGMAYGPGEAGFEQALKAEDDAFARFFGRLSSDGITPANTLFVVTADENDHFVGGAPSPATCDGVTTPCTYAKIGEINANLAALLQWQKGITTPFAVHADSAPTIYLKANPAPGDSATRAFARAAAQLRATNPMTGGSDTLTHYLADSVEMKLLHMVTADPQRTPSLTLFADPNYYLYAKTPAQDATCASGCVTEQPASAWNHGDVSSDINTTWLGLVGPGVHRLGASSSVWSSHTDIRPTMLLLLGLKDDYTHEGRPLFEVLADSTLPPTIRASRDTATQLAAAYTAIESPVGPLGLASLTASTRGLAGGDATYARIEGVLSNLTTQRDQTGSQMLSLIEGASFDGKSFDTAQAQRLTSTAQSLVAQAQSLAGA